MDGRGYDYILQRPQLGRLSRLPFPSICKVARPLFPNSLPVRPHNCEYMPPFLSFLRQCAPWRNILLPYSLCSLLFRSHSFDTIRDRCHQKIAMRGFEEFVILHSKTRRFPHGETVISTHFSHNILAFELNPVSGYRVECQVCKGRRWLRWLPPCALRIGASKRSPIRRGFIATAKNGELPLPPSLHGMEKFNGKQRGRVK